MSSRAEERRKSLSRILYPTELSIKILSGKWVDMILPLVDGHALYTQEGLLMDRKYPKGCLGCVFIFSCVYVMPMCVSIYVTVDTHMTWCVSGAQEITWALVLAFHLVWRVFVCTSACTRLAGLWVSGSSLTSASNLTAGALGWQMHVTTPCFDMGSGPHAYAASSLPTQHLPSPASQVYSKELIGTKLANIVVNITDCLLFGFYRAQLFKAKTIFCTNNTQRCHASTDDWGVVVCKHTHIHRHTQWEEITLVGKE